MMTGLGGAACPVASGFVHFPIKSLQELMQLEILLHVLWRAWYFPRNQSFQCLSLLLELLGLSIGTSSFWLGRLVQTVLLDVFPRLWNADGF